MMSLFGRSDICSIQTTGNRTSTRSVTAVPKSSTRRLLRDRNRGGVRIGRAMASAGLFMLAESLVEPPDEQTQEKNPGDHQRRDRTSVTPVREVEGLHEAVIVRDLGGGTGAPVGEDVDE